MLAVLAEAHAFQENLDQVESLYASWEATQKNHYGERFPMPEPKGTFFPEMA